MAHGTASSDSPDSDSDIRDAAFLFRLAAHPLRLRILLLLAEGERDPTRLASELGCSVVNDISSHLGPLRKGSLITKRIEGRKNVYALTEKGSRVVGAYRLGEIGVSSVFRLRK